MTDLFLIAHKVRGEPAFDIAHQMECPECDGDTFAPLKDGEYNGGCSECDGLGYWWIIPTSGHRAYPWWHCPFTEIMCNGNPPNDPRMPTMPPDLPDHYPTRAAPTVSLIDALGLRKPKAQVENSPTQPIARRF